LQLTSIESYATKMKIRLVAHQKFVSAGLDCQSVFPENDDKIVSEPLRRHHSKNAQFAMCMGEGSGHRVGCAEH